MVKTFTFDFRGNLIEHPVCTSDQYFVRYEDYMAERDALRTELAAERLKCDNGDALNEETVANEALRAALIGTYNRAWEAEEALAAANKRVAELETVEWIVDKTRIGVDLVRGKFFYRDCPWCGKWQTVYDDGSINGGHAPDCVRRNNNG